MIIREKILHHTMRGDRAGFSTVVASLFLRLVPGSYYWEFSPGSYCWLSLPHHFWTQRVIFRRVSIGTWAMDG